MVLSVQSKLGIGRVVPWTKSLYRHIGMEQQVLGIFESQIHASMRCYSGSSDICRVGT
jgi:hypothetical protein